ncbi:MAG: DUF5671 domain-containing protein [Patescibacteria group bacterium]
MDNLNESPIKKSSAKEVFLHLLAIFTLYGSATSFLVLLFQYINFLVPDILSYEVGYARPFLGPLRFGLSTLIVVYPVFIAVSWFLNKSYLQNAANRELRLRKWLIYFTLFVAAIVMIGDLVTTVNTFLSGGLTSRFILKAFSVLLIAGLIFGYYLYDVRRIQPSKKVRRFVYIISGVIAATIIGGFFLVGSPKEERLFLFDQQKVYDLQNIQGQIINYWQRKVRLPETLDNLNDDISGFQIPLDQQTGASYEYSVKGAEAFELCATFNRPSLTLPSQQKARSPYMPMELGQNWDHKEGRICFERIIDKDLYPPFEKR